MQALLFFHQKEHKAGQLSGFWEALLLVCCLGRSGHTGSRSAPIGAATCHSCPRVFSLCRPTLPRICKELPGFSFSLFQSEDTVIWLVCSFKMSFLHSVRLGREGNDKKLWRTLVRNHKRCWRNAYSLRIIKMGNGIKSYAQAGEPPSI